MKEKEKEKIAEKNKDLIVFNSFVFLLPCDTVFVFLFFFLY